MKTSHYLVPTSSSLAITLALLCLQPHTSFGQQEDPAKKEKKNAQAAHPAPQAAHIAQNRPQQAAPHAQAQVSHNQINHPAQIHNPVAVQPQAVRQHATVQQQAANPRVAPQQGQVHANRQHNGAGNFNNATAFQQQTSAGNIAAASQGQAHATHRHNAIGNANNAASFQPQPVVQNNTIQAQTRSPRNQNQNPSTATYNAAAAQPQSTWQNNGQAPQRNNQGQYIPQRGNQSDNYGGQWTAASYHPYWGNSGQHYWNNNNYQWYNGGWLIVTPWVSINNNQAYYGYSGYSGNGSISFAVQQRLTDLGYYIGPIDGEIGPDSSQAIANYQADQDLRVTGRINRNLVAYLGL